MRMQAAHAALPRAARAAPAPPAGSPPVRSFAALDDAREQPEARQRGVVGKLQVHEPSLRANTAGACAASTVRPRRLR